MRAFSSRQYARKIEKVGTTEKLIGVVLLLLLAGIVVAFVGTVATDAGRLFDADEDAYAKAGSTGIAPQVPGTSPLTVGSATLFPDSGVAGWHRPSNVARYTPQNLHVKIDGRAELYLRFDVVGLTFGTYEHESDAGRTIDVYWYEMGSPERAEGIYHAEAAPSAALAPVGTEAYQIGGAVFFRHAASYVQVLPARVEEADAEACLEIARRIAAEIAAGGIGGE